MKTARVCLFAFVSFLFAVTTPLVALGQSAYRFDKVVQGPTGQAIAGASIAVCNQPANITSQPCSVLATLYPDSSGTNYTISSIYCWNYVATVTTTANNTIPLNQWW